MTRDLVDALAELGWSLWTELGVPGVVRRHRSTVIDVEVLVCFTPWLARADARLYEEARRWCIVHRAWLSRSRMKALQKASPTAAASVPGSFLHSLDTPEFFGSRGKPHLDRPSLLQLRLRALSGVGARADVLGQLLRYKGQPVTAADVAWLGYSKRAVAAVLAELELANLAYARREGNRVAYSLAKADEFGEWVGAAELEWVDWRRVFLLLYEVDLLVAQQEKPHPVRRVRAATQRDVLASLADHLGLQRPPSVAGVPMAWELLSEWGLEQARVLARAPRAEP